MKILDKFLVILIVHMQFDEASFYFIEVIHPRRFQKLNILLATLKIAINFIVYFIFTRKNNSSFVNKL